MNLRWLVRMSVWLRRPPSRARVYLILAVVGVGLLIVAAERAGWWPEAMTTQKIRL
ncbi:hypothetical protein [Roseobacter ponti]|uniref:hypothetical protein n=1 Tax=Roseobacter ponti TaxID=1891787 RepID=UPI001469DE0F|nr:hypothetical protein [Roseobacter ponti]